MYCMVKSVISDKSRIFAFNFIYRAKCGLLIRESSRRCELSRGNPDEKFGLKYHSNNSTEKYFRCEITLNFSASGLPFDVPGLTFC